MLYIDQEIRIGLIRLKNSPNKTFKLGPTELVLVKNDITQCKVDLIVNAPIKKV